MSPNVAYTNLLRHKHIYEGTEVEKTNYKSLCRTNQLHDLIRRIRFLYNIFIPVGIFGYTLG